MLFDNRCKVDTMMRKLNQEHKFFNESIRTGAYITAVMEAKIVRDICTDLVTFIESTDIDAEDTED